MLDGRSTKRAKIQEPVSGIAEIRTTIENLVWRMTGQWDFLAHTVAVHYFREDDFLPCEKKSTSGWRYL